VIAILAFLLCRFIIGQLAKRRFLEVKTRFRVLKATNFILNTLLAIALFELWVSKSWSTAGFIGLLSAGLAFVFREPLINLAAWLYILIRQPFSLGDRVQIGDVSGDVVDIGVTDFTLMEIGNWVKADQSTGRLVTVPNGWLFTRSLANSHRGFPFLWHEVPIVITYESDWKTAQKVYTDILTAYEEVGREARQKTLEELEKQRDYLISFQHLTPIVYASNANYGIRLTGRYLCDPRKRRSTEARIFGELLNRLKETKGVSIAYPTFRIGQAAELSTAEPDS
jgi:small-conductance mechanosensitive channel